ncbi:MAG: hypothetical protein ACO1TE_03910 [Prosthecobacter sp.]
MSSERWRRNLEHAQWRVNFAALQLRLHRLGGGSSETWRLREIEFVEATKTADKELERLKRENS